MTRTSIFTASPFLLRFYRTFSNLYIDENTINFQKNLKLLPQKLFFRASHCKNIKHFGLKVGFILHQFNPK